MSVRVAVVLSLIVLVSACGGGSGSDPTDPTKVSSLCSKESIRALPGSLIVTGLDGSGGGPGGDSPGDGTGANGQFRNTLVVLKDANLQEIAQVHTDDEKGMISFRIPAGCPGPFEVEFRGGDAAQYFDEGTGRFEAFPAGYRLRMRTATLPRHFGVTPLTEAAARLMDFETGGSLPLTKEAIERAEARVAEIATDQIPGVLRAANDGSFGLINIIQQPSVLNDQNAKTAGTLSNDAAGRYGTMIAGFGKASATFVGDTGIGTGGALNAATGPGTGPGARATATNIGPALKATDQLAEDLADGRLDLQGPRGNSVVQDGDAPAYTYETLWRAKSVAAGLTSGEAGDQSLRSALANVKVAEYVFSFASVYMTQTCRDAGCSPFEAHSSGGQTVRLFADGRLMIQRGTSVAFGVQRRYLSAVTAPEGVKVELRDDRTGADVKFADVKIGSRGEIIALRQDRLGVVYVDPMSLYIVRGDEDPSAASDAGNKARLEETLGLRFVQMEGTGSRILSFTPSPVDRTYAGGSMRPDVLFVLSDGSLWGAQRASPGAPFRMNQPELLTSVVYDKYVPPGSDPRYGPQGTAAHGLPWNGPRRLYGLTRGGTVVTWIEGESAPGVRLGIPGTVVLLSAESRTGVYALTSDGRVFWINADQAIDAVPGELTEQASYRRRFPLHHIEEVRGFGGPVCWIARAEAVECKTGALYQWTEAEARLTYGGSGRQSTYVPVGERAVAASIPGLASIWRLSAVESFYRRSLGAQSLFIEGLRLLTISGQAVGLEEALGQRNLLIEAPIDDAGGPSIRHLKGFQVRRALEEIFRPQSPLSLGIERASTFPLDRRLLFAVTPAADGTFQTRLAVDADSDPRHPPVIFNVDFHSTGQEVDRLEIARLRGGDPNTGVDTPQSRGVRIRDNDPIALDNTFRAWDLRYTSSIRSDAGNDNNLLRLKIVPMPVLSKPYEFRICFYVEGQSDAGTSVRFERTGCTHHDYFGRYLGRFSGGSIYITYSNGTSSPPGNLNRTDFGQLYEYD